MNQLRVRKTSVYEYVAMWERKYIYALNLWTADAEFL